jgi:serine/threonine protein kinase
MKLHKIKKDELKVFKIEDFTLVDTSRKNSGSFGVVTLAFIKTGNIPVVLKRYKEPITNTILSKDINKEIIILQHLNQYPETMTAKLYGICIEYNPRLLYRYCYLVLERLETDLHHISISYKNDVTKNDGKFTPLQYKIIFYKLLKALNAIHSLGFIHNDIKLPNIMLNGTDIKFIDFGLSKYLGLNPLYKQVNRYNTTDVIKAPESRISFSSDIFSVASTMIHLVLRGYVKIRYDNASMQIYDKINEEVYNAYLSQSIKFGKDGFNLLCNLLNSDPLNRYCANKALSHTYFDEIREIEKAQNMEIDIEIDRSIVGLLGGKPISGLENIVTYVPENFAQKNLELCYFEELHLNYKDDIFPIQHIENTIEYSNLINWLLQQFNLKIRPNDICYGLDTLLNCIIHTNNNFNKFLNDYKYQVSPRINPILVNTYVNLSMFHNIFTDGTNRTENILEERIRTREIIEPFYKNLNININLYPVSNHISYIYLQLLYIIKKLENSYEFSIDFYYDVSVMVIFWFIQPIPFDEPLTNWEIVVFSTIKKLSNILRIPALELLEKPLLSILVMDENRYTKMYEYYTHQYSTMDFEKLPNYKIYFNVDKP